MHIKKTQWEAAEQEAVIRWAEYAKGRYPELKSLYHIPNGGSRNALEAANLKRQGVRAGVPDLCLPAPKGKYAGLYIEMKAGNNKPTQKQTEWLSMLARQGYAAVVCYGADEAIKTIESYLKLGGQNNEQCK